MAKWLRGMAAAAAVGLALSLFLTAFPRAEAFSNEQQNENALVLPDIRDAYGVALADYDGDGDLDIYIVCFRSLNRLLENRGDGTFRDASIASGAGGNLMPRGNRNLELGASAADFDNDGDVDIVVAGWGESLELLRNRGDGTFEAVGEPFGLLRDGNANMALWADLDGDGWLDLLLTDETGPMRLYRNEHGLHFTPIDLATTGLSLDSGSQAGVFTDFNSDGRPDLAVAGWKNPAQVFEGLGTFRFRAVNLNLNWPGGSRCNAALHGDFDGDGDIDLIFTVRGGHPVSLCNQNNPATRITSPDAWAISKPHVAFQACDSNWNLHDSLDAYGGGLLDVDADGDLDLYLTGRQSERYYENGGHGFTFQLPPPPGWQPTGSLYSTGFAYGHLSTKPGLEAVVANRDTGCVLLPSCQPQRRLIRVDLHGVFSNPQGIGSQISLWRHLPKAKESDPWQFISLRDHPGSQGYLSSYIGPIYLALPDSVSEYRARIVFPSGKVVTRGVDLSATNLAVWESGFFGALGIRITRLADLWLVDPAHLKQLGLFLLAGLFALFLLRLVIRWSAQGIARREYTKAVEVKNAELESLLTQLHRTQEQLIHHEKLASLGQLVAGIAHELNNPIGFVYANLHQIARYLKALPTEALDERSLRNLERVDEALRESQEGALRVRDIVQNLRGLSRSDGGRPDAPPTKVPCELRELFDKALSVARTGFAPGIEVVKQYQEIPLIAVDPGQMQQVLLNLLVNAGQAMGEKGVMTLTTQQVGKVIIASVSDNGPGIKPENLARIFDPFFTTKPVGQGLGLGLHLAYSIIKAHGGDLSARSELGHGAVFEIRLPILDQKPAVNPPFPSDETRT